MKPVGDQRYADPSMTICELMKLPALLSLRGLKICEIARMRHTAEGTIKAQLSAVYRKSGISSRTELLALFMDEFLEYSTQPSATSPHHG
jgi:DNA-binding CsgD family transcriptional regulator